MRLKGAESRIERSRRLEDAEARFSEVVRLAREVGPQRVTLRGKDALVVVAKDEFDRLRYPRTCEALIRAMADPRVSELDFEHSRLRPPPQPSAGVCATTRPRHDNDPVGTHRPIHEPDS
jgi:prevent-host-death family protein